MDRRMEIENAHDERLRRELQRFVKPLVYEWRHLSYFDTPHIVQGLRGVHWSALSMRTPITGIRS